VHRLVADAQTVVTEATVSDGEQSARVIAFSELVGDLIVRQVEYWPAPYEPRPDRAGLAIPTARIP
jgi:hypothetical protein